AGLPSISEAASCAFNSRCPPPMEPAKPEPCTSILLPTSRGADPCSSATVTSTQLWPLSNQVIAAPSHSQHLLFESGLFGTERGAHEFGKVIRLLAREPRANLLDRQQHPLRCRRGVERGQQSVVGQAGDRVRNRAKDRDGEHERRLANRL